MADQKDILKVQKLVENLRLDYADDPNIKTVGYGLARRGGSLKDGMSIIFYVKRKYASDRAVAAAGSQPIPKKIKGFPTDVQESDMRPAQAGDRDEIKYDPLRGGVATSNSEEHIFWFNSSGTLGILARDNATDAPLAISNWHVWADGGEEGDQIIQPGHPTTGDHIEAIGKVAACGPLLTSLIEWEAPSPLASGLYGGAAAAAIAAAASDYRDPTRRGQDHTPTDPGELTVRESVDLAIEYPKLPLPGLPFQAKVKWKYLRETQDRVLAHNVEEARVNTQFLLGKMVVTDRASYQPGETVTLTAAIWDYQLRPCSAYHVVAHMIPHNNPDYALRVVLHHTTCPRTIPPYPPEDEDKQEVCVSFDKYKEGEYPYKGKLDWLAYLNPAQDTVRIVDWLNGTRAIQVPSQGLQLWHAPTKKVSTRVAQFTNDPVTLTAYNADGQVVGQATAPDQQGVIHELTVSGDGIIGALIRGGGGEGLLVAYCIVGIQESKLSAVISKITAAGISNELPNLKMINRRLKANRCCFTGSIALPPTEKPGKWDVHLTVQNINNVLEGTPPDQAATTIGGHILSSHTSPEVLGCIVIMLLDHVFDVI